ncbi:MAG: glycosyltransferase family 4 protein [Fastidiosipilaceae bacterium]|jgi:glycosyltransferase involved in cell wall biosynthesis
MMRIGLVIDSLSLQHATGIARYSQKLLHGLKDEGIDVQPILIDNNGSTPNHVTKHVTLASHVLKNISKVDVVHATSPMVAFSFPFISIPKILTYHDLISVVSSNHSSFWAPVIYRAFGGCCDRAIAVSSQTRCELIQHLNMAHDKVDVINLGVDDKFVPHSCRNERHYTIGYLGALVPRKGVDFLERSISIFKQLYPNVDLYLDIYGKKNSYYNELSQLSKDLGIDMITSFKGFVQDDAIVDVYNSFDIFVFPSEWEGFGIPILEAQRCGLPVVIRADANIPPEVSKCCIKATDEYDMANKIYSVIKDEMFRRQSIQNGLSYSKSFTWEKMVKETIHVYEEVY